MGCDGVFDVYSSEEVGHLLWKTIEKGKELRMFRKDILKNGVNYVLKECMKKGSSDNLTGILISFNDY